MLIKKLATYYSIKLHDIHPLYKGGTGRIYGEDVFLAIPRTYMNNSGEAVKEIVKKYKPLTGDLIVAYDDVDIELGKLKIKEHGGSGGHKGCASVIEALGTEEFIRVRMGIGRPPEDMDVVKYVLSPFKPSEIPLVEEMLEKASDAVKMIISGNIAGAMSKYNQR